MYATYRGIHKREASLLRELAVFPCEAGTRQLRSLTHASHQR